jgi:hypothetical protein
VLLGVLLATTIAVPALAGPPRGRLGVGDSIMLSAEDELLGLGFDDVNAKVGRQFGAGLWIVRHRAGDGTLPKRVVVHLGTNGTIDPDDCAALIEAAGPRRRVFLTTIKVPRSWEAPNNHTLNACARTSDQVHVIRWWTKSHDRPEWFASDGYHLNVEGRLAFARFVDTKVDRVLQGLRGERAR